MKLALLLSLAIYLPVFGAQHVVIIDPGHGGRADSGSQAARSLSSSNNATSPGGLAEKALTLELALEVKKQVEALASAHRDTIIECVLTRTDDSNPDFTKRASICASQKQAPAAIVSIHFNASTKHNALGTVAVIHNNKVSSNFPADQAFATGLTKATNSAVRKYVEGSSAQNPISDAHLHGGAGSNFFYQIGLHPSLKSVPKCFLEIEFIDRKDVEQKLLQNREATFPVIARAIAEYLYEHCATQAK